LHEGLGIASNLGTVARPVGIRIVLVLQAPRHRIAFDEVGAKHFCKPASSGVPPQFHLK
jgi:hypothetical protein